MRDHMSLKQSTQWLGVCLVSALFTLASISFVSADPNTQGSLKLKTYVFSKGDGSASEATEHVDVSIKFDKLIVVNDLSKREMVLTAKQVDGVMSDTKSYCVAKNYAGNVRLRITGDHSNKKVFQLEHVGGTGGRIPITVKVKDEKAPNGAAIEFYHGDEKDITAIVPDNQSSCSTPTTTLTVETNSTNITEKSGTYRTKLHLRFVAL